MSSGNLANPPATDDRLMSGKCGRDFVAAAEHALSTGDFSRISDAEIQQVMTAAVRVYAAKSDFTGTTPLPVAPNLVTPTDTVVTVCELIRAAGLNLWDLSMWFSRKPVNTTQAGANNA
jgi:hypothetical protein